MKALKHITTAFLFLLAISVTAQQGINYKALIKDGGGNVVANQSIAIQFQILQGVGMINVYQETHAPTTDDNGLIMINIGEGVVDNGIYADVDWGADDHFLNVQINTGGGLTDMGTTQFMAVPYALNAATSSDNYWSENGNDIYNLNNNVGIGTTTPNQNLEIYGINPGLRITSADATPCSIDLVRSSSSYTDWRIENQSTLYFSTSTDDLATPTRRFKMGISFFEPSISNTVSLGSNNNLWSFVYAANGMIQTSDHRFKKDIRSFSYGLKTVIDLNPISYRWKDRKDKKTHLGLIAQEVQLIVPEIVYDENSEALGMNYSELVPVLIKAIQEQQEIIENLKDENEQQIKQQNNTIEKLLKRVEQLELASNK